jgi:hypothetical protein
MSEAAVLLRHLPGIGNPLHLPVDEFNGYLQEVFEHLKRQSDASAGSGPMDHRAYVEQQMRRANG